MIGDAHNQKEAERERRAKIIAADGEFQASEKLSQAARVIAAEEGAMQLRYLATLGSIANERSSTIVFPFPTDLAQLLGTKIKGNGSGNPLT